jgi:hypothetical protein
MLQKMLNKPLKFVLATKNVASTGLANARRLAGRYTFKIDTCILARFYHFLIPVSG